MNKKILILVGKLSPKKELFTQLISKGMGKEVEVSLDIFSHLFIEVDEGKVDIQISGKDIRDYDLIYFRRIDHSQFPLTGTLAMCLEKLGIKYFDTKFKEIGAAGNKMTSLTKLSLNGVSVPKTIFCSSEGILKNGKKIIAKLGLPIIAKNTITQGNKGVFVINKEEDLKQLVGEDNLKANGKPNQFIFQKYVGIDKEYRVLVLKDKAVVVHTKVKRRYDQFIVDYEDLNSNLEFINPESIPSSIKEAAVKAALALSTEVAGVDVCTEKETGKVIVLEVNRGPGFDYDPGVSPEIKEVAEFFKREIGIE
jgi:glutathione synthase/RimK-type ligase-like ATP-grasp enzyme